jgi:hypothetical protein
MGNLLINIRIGIVHFQLMNDWHICVDKNLYHIGYPYGFFEIYDFFGYHKSV